jgi:serine/threonine-protein kinase
MDAGAFQADLEDVRTDLGLARVPVPTGRSSAGPATIRPTNRPPRRQQTEPGSGDPGTEVLGAGRSPSSGGGRGGRTSMLPGMGAGPTTDVGGRRPAPAVRPALVPHLRRRRARLALAVVLLLAVTVGAVGWWMGSGRWTQVPSLVGADRAAAEDLLQGAGLDPVFLDEQFSETVPEGEVISADPDGGEAIRGTDVELVVSRGPERFTVDPALVGQPVEAVRDALQGVPVVQTEVSDYDEEVPAGSVTGFDPEPGTELRRDQPVTVFVSRGRAPVDVPNVVGQAADAAQGNLESLGFTVARTEGRSADVATGQVMAVTPAPGQEAPYGSEVTLQVSIGVPQVTVPDVTGQRASDAVAALEAAGLQVTTSTFITGDKVYRQSPGGGTVVDQGSEVSLLLSFG